MSEPKSKNIVWHQTTVTRDEREQINGHRGCTVWLTGLSGSGKSTLANLLEKALWERGVRSFVLDGDNVRHGLNKDLGFSPKDRTENIRRIGEVAALFTDAGVVNITAFISPYRADREIARKAAPEGRFIEVYVQCDLDECERRDPKNLYKKARAGEIPEFTGISAPYEAPEAAELIINTAGKTPEENLREIVAYLESSGFIPRA
ncbi:MAG TPA: adenylyl-sulfate kinase [Candidatus Limnocylindrales bacterium]|nr:adenylyl-sulfate kinase [Candidatus Limnocylindrales bacterium]